MCKIAMMSGIKPTRIKQAWELSKALAPYMSKADDDGFGYAAITKKGDVMVERWLDNDQAFRYKQDNKPDSRIRSTLGSALTALDSGYTSVGKIERQQAVAIILHSRMATCEKGIKNVHPFVVNGQALIHNGVISNHRTVIDKYDKNKTRLSTCDSEAIAFSYAANNVINNPEGIKVVGDDLTGYYACAVVGKDDKNNPIMDVFKSESASLYATWVPQVEALVYCTSLEILKSAIKDCRFTYYRPYKINSEVLIRHNAVTGEASPVAKFKERGYSYANYSGYGSYDRSGYDSMSDWHDRSPRGSTQQASSSTSVINMHGKIDDIDTPGVTSLDSRTGRVTETSWEDFLNKRPQGPTDKEEVTVLDANSVIVREIEEKAPSSSSVGKHRHVVPIMIMDIVDAGRRNQAIGDYLTICDKFDDFRAELKAKYASGGK